MGYQYNIGIKVKYYAIQNCKKWKRQNLTRGWKSHIGAQIIIVNNTGTISICICMYIDKWKQRVNYQPTSCLFVKDSVYVLWLRDTWLSASAKYSYNYTEWDVVNITFS